MAVNSENYPFNTSTNNQLSIDQLGEKELLQQLKGWLGQVNPPSPVGMGDDCAVNTIQSDKCQLLTTDSITYGRHFDDSVSPADAGAKLIKRNLSDIAAMGGAPGPALLSLLCGPDLSIIWLKAFIDGICESCESYAVTIVGGDVSQVPPGNFSAVLALTGTSPDQPLLRSTAGIGDSIYVTGSLGGSILGKHVNFEPRLLEGQWLSKQAECTAMMDLSDGLGKDLTDLLPDGSSAAIDLEKIPISTDASTCAKDDGLPEMRHAFCDGEDYELVFTLAAGSKQQAFEAAWCAKFPNLELSRIGQIVEANSSGRYIDAASSEPLPWLSGFEHFKKA